MRWRWMGLAMVVVVGQVWAAEEHPARARALAEVTAVAPGGSFWVATELTMREGWHVYWINPGDSGLPPTTEWEVPEGVELGPVQWPYPQAFRVGPLVSLGYEGRVLLMQEVRVPTSMAAGQELVLRGKVSWLVCEDVCLPGSGEVEVRVPVRAEGGELDRGVEEAFAATRAAWPVPLTEGAVTARVEEGVLVLTGGWEAAEGMVFFALAEGLVRLAEPQTLVRKEGGFELRVVLERADGLRGGTVAGVLVSEKGFAEFGGRKAVSFEA
ncbi:MAG: protein-disulfide reductase DsbD domain-containing protein, partial [Verrucomicrobiia bacterium]